MGIVGDTHPLGCRFAKENVFYEFFENNPDFHDPIYSTELGIYEKGSGIMNTTMSFGHDEYLYSVLVHNKCSLPLAALFIVRFHSFYAWHTLGAYQYLMNDDDRDMLKWINVFNRFDLYSKSAEVPNLAVLKEYYQGLINKYLPGVLSW